MKGGGGAYQAKSGRDPEWGEWIKGLRRLRVGFGHGIASTRNINSLVPLEHFKYSKVKIYDLTKKELKYYTCFSCCHKKSPQINYHKLVVECNTTLLSCKFCRSEV